MALAWSLGPGRVAARTSAPGPAPYFLYTVCNGTKILIRDKLAYPGSLSASLSQELIAAYPWLAYRVAYPVAASRRCGQRLGGGRRLAGRRRLGGGGGSATAAPRSRLRLEGRWRGGRRRPAWRATARRAATRRRAAAWQRRRFGAGSAAGGLAAGGSAAAAAWQTAAPRSQFGVYLSFSLSFSLSRGLSVLIRVHIPDLCIKPFVHKHVKSVLAL